MSDSNFMNRFAVLDVETANPYDKGSICSIGIVLVDGDQIVDSYYSLINPRSAFHQQNIAVHGITENDVMDAPTFFQAWTEIEPSIRDRVLVCYNATFDIYALEKAMYDAGFCNADYPYVCAMRITKNILNLEKYALHSIAEQFGIQYENHNALEDAAATAKILFVLCRQANAVCISDLARMADVPVLYMNSNSYYPEQDTSVVPCITQRRRNYCQTHSENNCTLTYGSSGCFKGKTIVFSGNLSCADRSEAQRVVTEMGGVCKTSVSKNTNFVIVGSYDQETLLPECKVGQKVLKALQLKQEGYHLDILDEDAFLCILRIGL